MYFCPFSALTNVRNVPHTKLNKKISNFLSIEAHAGHTRNLTNSRNSVIGLRSRSPSSNAIKRIWSLLVLLIIYFVSNLKLKDKDRLLRNASGTNFKFIDLKTGEKGET